jgi:tetratricopeptide (TPR) repeat protein
MGNLPPIFSADWLMMVLTVFGLNLKTLVWPTELGILYEWVPSYGFRMSELILGGVAVGATLLLLWTLRRRKLSFFGLLWFGLALAPTSQLIPHHIARADRFLYLPLIGIAITAAAILGPLTRALKRPGAVGGAIAVGLLGLLLLAKISADQIQTWQNSYTMWQNCLRVSPNNPMAHTCFADILAGRGQFDKAIPHYHMALRVEPDRIETLNNFALRLGAGDNLHLRDYELAIRLSEHGCRLSEWKDPQLRHTLAMAHTNLAVSLTADRQFGGAIGNYRKAIEADPDYDIPLFDLAILLVTCPDQNLQDPDEAVRLAERARKLTVKPDPRRLSILAAAYAASGQFEMAARTAREALELAQASGQPQMIAELRSQLEAYRSH